jgi:TRAP-type C4-dicarboxylate transport system permease small subunit
MGARFRDAWRMLCRPTEFEAAIPETAMSIGNMDVVPPLWVRIIDGVSGTLGRTAGYLFALAPSILMGYEVISRYVFNSPTQFTLEFGLISQILLTATASAYVLRERGHVGMDIVTERLGPSGRRLVSVVSGVIGAGFCAFLAWLVLRSAMWSMTVNSLTETLELPLAPLQLAFVAGMLLLCLQFLAEIWKCLNFVDSMQ